MEEPAENPDVVKHETVKRPMNAFLIFCKRHRGLVHEKNPSLDNRSVTRILGDLWANLGPDEKYMYTDLAKQYKEAFLKANPDYKWYNPEKHSAQVMTSGNKPGRPSGSLSISHSSILTSTGISPGKLADPSNMGGLSMLLMAGQQTLTSAQLSTTNQQMNMMSSQPPPTRALTTTDQRTAEPTTARSISSNQTIRSWPTAVAPPAKKMDTDAETKTLAGGSVGRNLGGGRMEESESLRLRKNSVEWPMDLSSVTDAFQNPPFVESRPALAEIDRSSGGVSTRHDPTATERSPERGETISKVISDACTARRSITSPSVTPDTPQVIRSDTTTGHSSWQLSGRDVPRFFGPSVTPPSETDRPKLPFIGHPLTYLFNQPTQQLSTHQRLKILLPTSPPAVSALHSDPPTVTKNSDLDSNSSDISAKSSGVADDVKFDGLAKLSDLRKFVVEKVIEAAYSKEQSLEADVQSFPKTKKQLAVDKLSSTAKPNVMTPNRNGNQEPHGVFNNLVSRSMSVPSSVEDAATLERFHEKRRLLVESNSPERNGDVSAITIAEINEKLIMKVVQEEDVTVATSIHDLPAVGEGRMPLKLQKKYKRLDDVGNSGSPSTSFGSSSSDLSSSSVLELETSIGLTSKMSQLQPRFPCSPEKSGFPLAAGTQQKVNVLMNANLLGAYPEFLRTGSLLTGERRQLGLMTGAAGSNTGTVPSPKTSISSHSGVDKLIETLIQESFAPHALLNTVRKSGYSISQPQLPIIPITTAGEGSRSRPDHEASDPNSSHPLRNVNKPIDSAKALKRKRTKRTESAEHPPNQNGTTHSSDISNRVAGEISNRVEDCSTQVNPVDNTVRSPKRSRERAMSISADETFPDVSNAAASERFKSAECSDAVRIAGAWHLIDNILNERAIDMNGGRAREEINNNSREKAMVGVVDHDGLTSTSNKALRKSKRANQGLRYKELMSKGVLYASRKSMDSNILTEDNRDNMDAMNEDEGNDVCGVTEITFPRRRCHADSTSLDMDTEVGRRYKSGDFDLEAHIASLPACQIEVTDRKTAGKIKSRSHSQSAASTSVSFLRLPHQKRIDLKSGEIKNGNGISLEEISFCKLRRLSRLSVANRRNLRRLFGSARRKSRTYCIVQLLPLSAYLAEIVHPSSTHEPNYDEHAMLSPLACATLTVLSSSSSDDASSFSHQAVKEEQAAFDAQKREIQTSFDILAAAAAVSSSSGE